MWVFWIIVRLNKKINNKNPMKYDDVNEEGIRSIFPSQCCVNYKCCTGLPN